MKTVLWIGMVLLASGCYVSEPYYPPVALGPPPPTGVYAIGLNGAVDVFWSPVFYSGVWGYRVYRAPTFEGPFTFIGSTGATFFRDLFVINGLVYYYAVTTVDIYGYESTYSYDNAWAIPGPTPAGVSRNNPVSEPRAADPTMMKGGRP